MRVFCPWEEKVVRSDGPVEIMAEMAQNEEHRFSVTKFISELPIQASCPDRHHAIDITVLYRLL